MNAVQQLAAEFNAEHHIKLWHHGCAGAGQTYFFDSAYGIGVNFGTLKVGQVSAEKALDVGGLSCLALQACRSYQLHFSPHTYVITTPPVTQPLLLSSQDCPNHAVFVDVAAALDVSSTGTIPASLCIFEDDLSETAWRHRSTGAHHALLQLQSSCHPGVLESTRLTEPSDE